MNLNRKYSSLVALLAIALSLSACSGLPVHNGGGGTTASVSVTMVADTLPANPSILSFTVSITSIVLTPTSGTAQTITLNPARVVDLMRLQSDTAFLGTFASIPSGTYSSVTAVIGLPAQITFFNDTGSTITTLNQAALTPSCPNGAVCVLSVNVSGGPLATVAFTVPATGAVGVGLDISLNKIVSVAAGALTISFSNANTLSAFTLPRTGSNLAAGQLDLIEDVTGVVSLGGTGVTITAATATGRGSLLASTNANMILDKDPSGALCNNPTQGSISSCVSSNQAASMDAILKSDGTLTIQEIEPLLTTLQDTVEGIIISVSSPTQFELIVTDLLPAATNSRISSLHIGDGLIVNVPAPNPFLVDTKGLPVESTVPGTLANFQGATDTTPLRPGQTVSAHITSFTAATPPTSISDTITLRWTRFTATPVTPFSANTFNLSGFPSFFNASGTALAEDFPGTPTTQNVTNFDGIVDASGLSNTKPVAVRALFIENSTNTASPAFIAAKVRQH